VVIDAKLDGIRIQAHRRGNDVLLVTRSLDDITARLRRWSRWSGHSPVTTWCWTARP
jgi:ATP-dependent DNA ligase